MFAKEGPKKVDKKMPKNTRRATRSTKETEPCFKGDAKPFIKDLWVAKKGEVFAGPVIRMMQNSGWAVSNALRRQVHKEIEAMSMNVDNHYDSEQEREEEDIRRRRDRGLDDEEEEDEEEEECKPTEEDEPTEEEDEEDDKPQASMELPMTPKQTPALSNNTKTNTTNASKKSWVHEFLKH